MYSWSAATLAYIKIQGTRSSSSSSIGVKLVLEPFWGDSFANDGEVMPVFDNGLEALLGIDIVFDKGLDALLGVDTVFDNGLEEL